MSDYSASLIDHIWSNVPFGVSSSIIVTDIIDHFPLCASFSSFKRRDNDLVQIKFRDFSENNSSNFITDISLMNWAEVLGESNDPNICTSRFLNKFQSLYDKNFPVKVKYISKKRLNKPWLSLSLIKSIRLKHLYYKHYKLGFMSKISYNQYKNTLDKLIKKSRKLYYEKAFESTSNNVRKSWRLIKNILRPNSKSNNEVNLKANDNSCLVNKTPDVFNEYFSTIGHKLRDDVPLATITSLVFFHRH